MTGINSQGNVQVGHIEDAAAYRLAQSISQNPDKPDEVPSWSAFMQAATVEYGKKFGKHSNRTLLKSFEERDAAKVAATKAAERKKLQDKLAKLQAELGTDEPATTAAA